MLCTCISMYIYKVRLCIYSTCPQHEYIHVHVHRTEPHVHTTYTNAYPIHTHMYNVIYTYSLSLSPPPLQTDQLTTAILPPPPSLQTDRLTTAILRGQVGKRPACPPSPLPLPPHCKLTGLLLPFSGGRSGRGLPGVVVDSCSDMTQLHHHCSLA